MHSFLISKYELNFMHQQSFCIGEWVTGALQTMNARHQYNGLEAMILRLKDSPSLKLQYRQSSDAPFSAKIASRSMIPASKRNYMKCCVCVIGSTSTPNWSIVFPATANRSAANTTVQNFVVEKTNRFEYVKSTARANGRPPQKEENRKNTHKSKIKMHLALRHLKNGYTCTQVIYLYIYIYIYVVRVYQRRLYLRQNMNRKQGDGARSLSSLVRFQFFLSRLHVVPPLRSHHILIYESISVTSFSASKIFMGYLSHRYGR